MQQNYYQEDEIDLKQLFQALADRKFFIFGFTGLITTLAIVYVLSIAPTYKASISFLSPNQSSVLQLNKIKLTSETSETSETIYRNFLNKLMSSKFQKKFFDENNYLAKLNPENKLIKNPADFFANFSKSIKLETNKIQKNIEQINYEKPVILSLEGTEAQVIADFLNKLADKANTATVNELLTIIKQKIAIRIEEISKQKGLLLSLAKQDRLANITRIKIEDAQKINEANDKIARLRVKTKKLRLNEIQILSNNAKMAKSIGIIDNNFKKTNSSESQNSMLSADINNNQALPKWYLYGEKALLKELNILKNRVSDDPYIPEIITLQNELAIIKSNQVLKTLEARQDDSPFIAEINNLAIETARLSAFKPSSIGINAMQINQSAYAPENPIKPKKKLIVVVAFVTGFILSIFLAFMINVFRKEDDKAIST
jgi:LPS O-antigen subunit length determinant protein (WzzB/FepE family)